MTKFGRYTTKETLDRLRQMEQRGELQPGGGRQLAVTVLVAEAREFRQLAESLKPERLMQVVNDYLAPIVECVTASGGVIHDLRNGRGVSALFGAPLEDERHADKAVACAVQLHTQMQAFERAEPAIHLDIGVATGPVLAGNIGTSKRLEYAVVGAP